MTSRDKLIREALVALELENGRWLGVIRALRHIDPHASERLALEIKHWWERYALEMKYRVPRKAPEPREGGTVERPTPPEDPTPQPA